LDFCYLIASVHAVGLCNKLLPMSTVHHWRWSIYRSYYTRARQTTASESHAACEV